MFNEAFISWGDNVAQNVNKTLPFSLDYLEELKRRSEDFSLPRVEVGPDGQYVYYGSTDWYGLLYKDRLPTMEHACASTTSSAGNAVSSWRWSGGASTCPR